MAIYEVRTFNDIYTAIRDELKFQSTDTTSLNRVKRDINLIYQELAGNQGFKWARKNIDVNLPAHVSTGTAAATQGDKTVTLSSAPTQSQKGKIFFTTGYAEHYRIASHTAGASTLELETEFTGTTVTASTYKIYQDRMPLPVDVMDVHLAWTDHKRGYLEPMSDREYRNTVLNSPRFEGRPERFTLSEESDANEYDTISGLPALSTRASSGYVRTLVFASTVASYLSEGDEIEIHTADNEEYNGKFIIEDVSTTTIQMVGLTSYEESATADTNIVIELKNDGSEHREYMSMLLYPSLYDKATTVHVDAVKKVTPLEKDNDEPDIPIQYRMILVYGALDRAWRRHRNPEEAHVNSKRYNDILKKMKGKQGPGKDSAKLKMSRNYLTAGRRERRWSSWRSF